MKWNIFISVIIVHNKSRKTVRYFSGWKELNAFGENFKLKNKKKFKGLSKRFWDTTHLVKLKNSTTNNCFLFAVFIDIF